MRASATRVQKALASPAAQARGAARQKCSCGGVRLAGGECARCRAKRLGRPPARATNSYDSNRTAAADRATRAQLEIGAPGDAAEQAADRVAREVSAMDAPPLDAGCAELHRPSNATTATFVPSAVHEVIQSPGRPLEPASRTLMERRFGHDFKSVRIHADKPAEESARALGALAYTVGEHVVLGAGQGPSYQRLLAHELTHVVQQRHGPTVPLRLQRACLPAAACVVPAPGGSGAFGAHVDTEEAAARRRRAAMTPARAAAHGHHGHARQLEHFLTDQGQGALLGFIHGIFIDQDMAADVAASTDDCGNLVPPIPGAVKPCVSVHGSLNQEALQFRTTSDTTIGGRDREQWRVETLQTLIHEVQHVQFDTSGRPAPAGVVCTRSTPVPNGFDVDHELSELNAIMSEFPPAFDSVAAHHLPASFLANWFDQSIAGGGEDIRGILHALRCTCSCSDVDAFIQDTVAFVTATWTAAQKTAFHTELRTPARGLGWPVVP